MTYPYKKKGEPVFEKCNGDINLVESNLIIRSKKDFLPKEKGGPGY